MAKGRIVKALSGFYYVDVQGKVYTCRAKGIFRKDKITPLVGDLVNIDFLSDKEGILCEIFDRTNQFERPSVANIDQMVIVASGAIPVTDPYLIDRVIAIATRKNCQVLVVVNKVDLNPGKDLVQIYQTAGIPVVETSAASGFGVQELVSRMHGKVNAFTGNSGVGKSSILNAIDPNLHLKVDEVSQALGRGKHTTRHTELFGIDDYTFVIDTPGFSSFDTEEMNLDLKEHLGECFTDFAPYVDQCKFLDCKHLKENGCAVLEAVKDRKIALSRHQSYQRLYNELKDLKHWNS